MRREAERRKSLRWVGITGMAFFFMCLSLTPTAKAKDVYPANPITIICASPPGGGTDLAVRGVAAFLPEGLKAVSPGAKGGEMIVKNVPTASGMKARTTVYNEEPDGYTIGDLNVGHLYDYTLGSEKPAFDVRKFTWLFTSNGSVYVLVTPKKGPATWEEMLAAAKKEPLRWLAGSYGGSIHINSIWFKEVVNIPARFLTIAGATGVVSSLLRGDGDIALLPIDSAKSIIESKDVNVLVSVTEKRFFPQIPTIIEKGYPQFLPYLGSARLIWGPPNLDPEAKRVLTAAAKKMYANPKYQEYCLKIGSVVVPIVGDEVEKLVNGYINFYRDLVLILKKHMKFS